MYVCGYCGTYIPLLGVRIMEDHKMPTCQVITSMQIDANIFENIVLNTDWQWLVPRARKLCCQNLYNGISAV